MSAHKIVITEMVIPRLDMANEHCKSNIGQRCKNNVKLVKGNDGKLSLNKLIVFIWMHIHAL